MVVAIIALLVAILLPSLNEARALALQVRCLANGKQFGTAILYYMSDWHDQLPYTGPGLAAWDISFYEYLQTTRDEINALMDPEETGRIASVWVYPADEKRFMPANHWHEYGSAPFGYGTNSPNVLAGLPPPYYPPQWATPVWNRQSWKLWQIHSPADTMVFAETTQGNLSGVWSAYCADSYPGDINLDTDGDGINDSHAVIYNDSRYAHPYCNVAPRHPNLTANLTFLDGHAAGWNIVDIMKPPDENNDLWGRKLFD